MLFLGVVWEASAYKTMRGLVSYSFLVVCRWIRLEIGEKVEMSIFSPHSFGRGNSRPDKLLKEEKCT